jgi:hypothetical protein
VGQDPVEQGLEEIRIAQRSELAPSRDQCGLDGILGQVGVAQDLNRDRHTPVARCPSQGIESFSVALLRAVD